MLMVFTDTDGDDVAINPAHVQRVVQYIDNETAGAAPRCNILFANVSTSMWADPTITTVMGEFSEVVAKLNRTQD